jgi:hypothetical protein
LEGGVLEIGYWRLEVGDWKFDVGYWVLVSSPEIRLQKLLGIRYSIILIIKNSYE